MRLFRFARFSLFAILCCSAQAQPYGLTSRPAVGQFLDNVMPESAPVVSGNWSAVVAFTNLTFTNALGLTYIPGTSKLVVWEREGRIWSFSNTPSANAKGLVLDISNQCQGWDDSGLLNLAFHPGFSTNHFVFLYYTWVAPGTVVGDPNTRPAEYVPGKYHDRISRFTLDANNVAVAGSEVVFVDQVGDSTWHNGSGLFFHPVNGFLYWTDGDDERAPTQIINQNLLSGVFRIDVDMRGGSISHPIPRQPQNGTTANYYIPNSNPFVGQAGVLEEFYALGLRSPHRMTYDSASGRIFLADVGNASREEIDVIEPSDPAGLNFQWSVIEGLGGDLTPPYIGVNKRPILDYTHASGDGYAVIGGYVYRGSQFAADLGGKYIFGDNVTRNIWALDESTSPASKILLCVMPRGPGVNSGSDYLGLSSFGLDANGELYLCQMGNLGGHIYRLARSGPPPASRPMPPLLSQTGAFQDLPSLTPSPRLIPYTVNSPLWSDAAQKQRWMALPTNTLIHFAPTGEWTFPNGTVFVKHFALQTNESDPNSLRRLETRLLVRDTNGTAYGVTYKWRPDNSEADLLTNSLSEDIAITTPSGTRTQQWYYPSRSDCLRCHTPAATYVLGVKTRQLTGNFSYPASGVTDIQLRSWNHIGLFDTTLNEANIPSYDKLVTVTDSSASLETRMRSYLDGNCSQCHRPGGVPALWDARYDTALTNQGIVNGPVVDTLGITGAKVVAPQNLSRSIMYVRVNALDDHKMPPLARNTVDTNAVNTLTAWINSLPPATNSLPNPWLSDDIGSVGIAGDAQYSSGTFSVQGSGDDIWNNADAFHYVYQPLNGDGEIRARIVSIQNTDPWAKAGVMIRETATAGSEHAFALVAYGNGVHLQSRATTGGASADAGGPGSAAPYWVRLTRAGNVFTAYSSADGSTWTQFATQTIGMGSSAYAGLAVTAHNNAALNSSLFDNVTVISSNPTTPPAVVQNPASSTRYVGGNASFIAQFSGATPLSYQWRFNGGALASGTTNNTTVSLLLRNAAVSNAGSYVLYVTNAYGYTNTTPAVLTVVTPPRGMYAELLAGYQPLGYWRFEEAGANPPISFDYFGGNDLANTSVSSVAGVSLPGFEAASKAARYNGTSSGSQAAASLMNGLTRFTISGWFKADAMPQPARTALFGQNDVAEFGFHNSVYGIWVANGAFASLPATITLNSGTWYFAVATADGTNLNLYLNGSLVDAQPAVLAGYSSGYPFKIGSAVLDATGNYFAGNIDEVAIFDKALSAAQIQMLFSIATNGPVQLQIRQLGPSTVLTWSYGTLQSADQASGGFFDVPSATSPWTNTYSVQRKFFRVRVN
jgi:uncharacterized repeat protein (TIGR03806 family)